jgi:hypothetical protein
VINFVQNPSLEEITIPRSKPPFQGDSAPKHVGAMGLGHA